MTATDDGRAPNWVGAAMAGIYDSFSPPPLPQKATPLAFIAAIAGALYDISAHSLSDHCDAYGIPAREDAPEPMSGKRRHVEARLKDVSLERLIVIARQVTDDHPHPPLVHLVEMATGARDAAGAARNVVFAAIGPKPQIVLADAVSNILEITEGSDRCLMYDKPLPQDGLRWSELVAWWAARERLTGLPERDQAASLYERLLRSLDNGGEQLMFRTYCALYRNHGYDLPALLPQVYLHYDQRSRGQGGQLVRQRMDFLLLLRGRRVVLELDGHQHYAAFTRAPCGHWPADPHKYAEMAREDRKLRLAGYEVFRFGGAELMDAHAATEMLTAFYTDLLELPLPA